MSASLSRPSPSPDPSLETLTFPQDILDLFIENVAFRMRRHEGLRCLIACTLVSRSFSMPARKQLWYSLRPRAVQKAAWDNANTFISARINAIISHIQGPTDFKSLIRRVEIEVGGRYMRGLNNHCGLPSLLEALRLHAHNLECVWITGVQGDGIPWFDINDRITSSVKKLLQTAKILRLSFSNLHDLPFDTFSSSPSIISLDLISSKFSLPSPLNSSLSKSPRPIHLQELVLHNNISGFEEDLTRANLELPFLKLAELSIFCHDDAHAGEKLLSKTAESLRTLDLTVPHNFKGMTENIDIGRFPALHTFRLNIQFGRMVLFPPIADVFRLVDPLRYPTRLETIEVSFSTEIGASSIDTLIYPFDVSWRSLHPAVLLLKHPNIRSIYIKLDVKVNIAQNMTTDKGNNMFRDKAKKLKGKIRSLVVPPSSIPSSLDSILELDVVVWNSRYSSRDGMF